MLREMKTRFGQLKLGYVWALFEPLMFIGFFAVLWSALGRTPGGLPLLPFLVTGFGTFMFFNKIMQFMLMALRINRVLLTFPQVTPFNITLARALLEAGTVVVVYIALIFLAAALGYSVEIESFLRLMVTLLLMALLGFGVGVIFSTLIPIVPAMGELIGAFISRPLLILSGNFYTAEMLPDSARDLMLFNPLLHGTELARDAYFTEFQSSYASMEYLAAWAFGMLFVGLLTQRALRTRVYQAS